MFDKLTDEEVASAIEPRLRAVTDQLTTAGVSPLALLKAYELEAKRLRATLSSAVLANPLERGPRPIDE
jgi:hypothetical protein